MSTLESYGGSWIISMEKEHELYLRKVKRDKWKVRAIRILILVAFILSLIHIYTPFEPTKRLENILILYLFE